MPRVVDGLADVYCISDQSTLLEPNGTQHSSTDREQTDLDPNDLMLRVPAVHIWVVSVQSLRQGPGPDPI